MSKTIPELQLRSSVTDDLSIPSDDGLQSYRVTALMIKNYILTTASILTAMIADSAVTLAKLASPVQQALVPSGAVLPFAGTSAPTGFLACDGTAVSRSTYSALFAAIGIAHGQGDGSTTFNLPNYQGRFLRGVDGSAGIDPDKASRTAMATGGNTGNNVGSVQADAFKSHTHLQTQNNAAGASASLGSGGSVLTANSPWTTNATGGNETRPFNAYVNFIIKT